jgi:hypothetical protein
MATAIVAANAAAVIAAMDKAGTAIQPTDLVVPTGVGQADGLMRHQDKARLDSLGAYYNRALVHAIMLSF